jgi:hypothetical protein
MVSSKVPSSPDTVVTISNVIPSSTLDNENRGYRGGRGTITLLSTAYTGV